MSKIDYIYRLEAGYSYMEWPERVEFFYARNSKQLIKYAQGIYHDKKYNKYKTIKVGTAKAPEEMRMITGYEAEQLKKYCMGDAYAERIEP